MTLTQAKNLKRERGEEMRQTDSRRNKNELILFFGVLVIKLNTTC